MHRQYPEQTLSSGPEAYRGTQPRSALYMPSSTDWYFFWSCGRFSLNVGVISSSSTVNCCGSSWIAFTASKPCSAQVRAAKGKARDVNSVPFVCSWAHDSLTIRKAPPFVTLHATTISTCSSQGLT